MQCGLSMFNDSCMTQASPNRKKKDSMEISDIKSIQGCKDIGNVLSNDPFDMVFTAMSSKEAFGDNELNICLPTNPFDTNFGKSEPPDMDLSLETALSAIDWIADFVLESNEFDSEDFHRYKNVDDYKEPTVLHFVWTSSVKPEGGDKNEIVGASKMIDSTDWSYENNNDKLGGDVKDFCFGCDIYQEELVKVDNQECVGAPADALYLALGHLGVIDLLKVEGVCKSLHDAVRNDPLLWQNIKIDSSLNLKMTDERLMSLADRAQGTLHSLNLFDCLNVTNVGLRHVLESNRRLTKLDVARCRKVKVEGLLQDLKVFNTVNSPGIKYLRISNLDGLTNQHVKEFQHLLGVTKVISSNKCIPRYHVVDPRYIDDPRYIFDLLHLSLEDEHALDVETCPKCEKPAQVFDCPLASCKDKIRSENECKGCLQCIARCAHCGCCLGDKPYEESFDFDLYCMDCHTYHLRPEIYRIHIINVDSCG